LRGEAALLAFRNKNIGALPESLGFRRDQIAAGKTRLFALATEEAGARLRRATVITNMRNKGQTETGQGSTEATTLVELKSALAAQLATFTADSPSVVSLKARIAALEKSLPDFNSPSTNANSLPGEIKEIDARLAEISVEKAALEETQQSLEASLLATPANETSLRNMEMERDNIQAQYTAAVARLAEASTGERVEALLKGERLELFQEALPPEYPRSPQRRFIVIGAFLAGILLAAGLMLAREMLNSKIRRPAELERRLSIKPLGVIPYFDFEKPKAQPPRKIRVGSLFKPASLPITGGQQSWTA
jgi:succinoglycan biosynthesis transport protein ExoP